jgi:hypothetical protein
MFRFSLRILFAFIALVGFALFALINYSPWLCSICCHGLILTIVAAATGSVCCRGASRAFSAGFMATALLYMWTAFAGDASLRDYLAINHLVDWARTSIHGNFEPTYGLSDRLRWDDGREARWDGDTYVTDDGRRFYPPDIFDTTCNCVLVVLSGLIIGAASAVVWTVHDPRRAREVSSP